MTVQGPVKEQQRDGMSHGGGGLDPPPPTRKRSRGQPHSPPQPPEVQLEIGRPTAIGGTPGCTEKRGAGRGGEKGYEAVRICGPGARVRGSSAQYQNRIQKLDENAVDGDPGDTMFEKFDLAMELMAVGGMPRGPARTAPRDAAVAYVPLSTRDHNALRQPPAPPLPQH